MVGLYECKAFFITAKSFFPLHFACCDVLLCHRPLVGPMEDHQGCHSYIHFCG